MTQNSQAPDVTVIDYAMWTSVGHDGPSSVSAMRAGLPGSTQAALWDHFGDDKLNAFRVNAHQWWAGDSFLPHLAAPVITDCRAALGRHFGAEFDAAKVPVFVNIAPACRPMHDPALEQNMASALSDMLAAPLSRESVVFSGGRVGVPYLLNRVGQTAGDLAIIVGVESFLQQPIVAHYNDKKRLLSAANSNGFIAGEASAGLILRKGTWPGLRLSGMGLGHEPGKDGGSKDNPVTARGLTDAMRGALSVDGSAFYDIMLLMGDLNGEHFKFKESAFAAMRLDRVPPEGQSRRPRGHVEHWNVAETIGEVGAALMPAAIGWAFEAGRSGYLPGKTMFSAGEDDGRRVAVVGSWING